MPLVPPARTRKRVTLVDQRNQPCRIDVGIDLRGRDVRMAQHCLQRTQIGAPFEQVSRKSMAQSMRPDPVRRHARSGGKAFHNLEKPDPA